MKMRSGKIIKKIVCTIFAGAMILSTCGVVGNVDADAAKTRLNVAKKKVNVTKGKTVKVAYKASCKVKAGTSKKKVARVSVTKKNIVIKGLKKGRSVVTLSCKDKKVKIKVTVKNAKDVNVKKDAPATTPTPVPTANPDEVRRSARELSPLAASVNKFGMQVYNGVRKDNENAFVSGFSIYTALAMLANGAEGNTRTELLNALGITDLDSVNNMMKTYCSGSMDESVTFNIANSVWLGKTLIPSAMIDNKFINPLMTNYNSEVYRDVDFTSADTVKQVNGWVDQKTNGMIKKIVDEQTLSQAVAMIMNALYFQGRWTSQFREADTADEAFFGVDGQKTVKMMTMYNERFSYFNNGTFKGIELPYGNKNAYAMDIILTSDDTVSTTDKWKNLTADEQVNQIMEFDNLATSKKTKVLKLPKFNIDYSVDDTLMTILSNIGIRDVFSDRANLTNIGEGLFVSKIIHKTALEVNEEGSKAAAVTAIMMECTSAMPVEQEEEIEFIVNRPFVVAIRDKVSGMVLFMGEVNKLQAN